MRLPCSSNWLHLPRTTSFAALALALAAPGCDRGAAVQPEPAATGAAPSASPSVPPGGENLPASTATAVARPEESEAETAAPKPVGAGVDKFSTLEEAKGCDEASGELATYLQRGELAIAGHGENFAASWLIRLGGKPEAQLAFAGLDARARQVARARKIGSGTTKPALFATGSEWTAAWFEADGLRYVRTTWDAGPEPPLQRIEALGGEASKDAAVGGTPSGSLVATLPFGDGRDKLGLFLFAPLEPGAPPLTALGVTRGSQRPRRPAVAADGKGYFLAWHEEDSRLVASRFDSAGKEVGQTHLMAAPGAPRDNLSLVPTSSGAIALWLEGETLLARGLDGSARPTGPAFTVGRGKWPAAVGAGDGALVAWVGNDGRADEQLLLARLGPTGAPASSGLAVSANGTGVKDPPALAVASGRVALGWTEVMAPGASTRRAVVRMLAASCVPGTSAAPAQP